MTFSPFSVDEKLSSLEDFVNFVDVEFEFHVSFSDVLLLCLRDEVTGVGNRLHKHTDIAHKELKPGNKKLLRRRKQERRKTIQLARIYLMRQTKALHVRYKFLVHFFTVLGHATT